MYRRNLLTSIAVSALCVTSFTPDAVAAQERLNYNIPSQDLGAALRKFAKTSKLQVIFDGETARGKRSSAITIHNSPDTALKEMLNGTGLTYQRNGKIYIISPAQTSSLTSPYLPSALMGASAVQASAPAPAPQYDEIIVTAQKKEERITDVPIAMSAFSAESLDELKIEGGSELLRAVPNVTFSKTNFASYNFSIRGIGTKALSASSDPAVAISYNYIPLIRNRLYEQEYIDVERIEVLRGPQGTLYGRNATGGVVNMIPKSPDLENFSGSAKLEVGSYEGKRGSLTVNAPLSSRIAARISASFTKRDGFDYNTVTKRSVNGRDLFSTRAGLLFELNDKIELEALWEHFSENDDRSRTGKQLCTKDPSILKIGNRDISSQPRSIGAFSQGCLPKSIFKDEAYDTPNGLSLPYISAANGLIQLGREFVGGPLLGLIRGDVDPYQNVNQSKDLREISTAIDPKFRAKNNIFYISSKINHFDNIDINIIASYTSDNYYSFQDYNRFNSSDIFLDSSLMLTSGGLPNPTSGISPGGILNDPQLGPSKKILAADVVNSKSDQWYFEIRSASDFSGPINYNVGTNYLKFNVDEDYYVFSNLFTAAARTVLGTGNNGAAVQLCENWSLPSDCTYVDPNPLSRINGDGHNYFRSRNKGSTESASAFGEIYWNASGNLKFTGGLRYTHDKKLAEIYPTQLLLGTGLFGAGVINKGYFRDPDVVQQWKRLTGRAVIDWKPDLDISDDTLLYASYSRGYKGGGANPPRIGVNLGVLKFYPSDREFKPESVNAFEIGTKNILLDRKMNLNFSLFYYDYKGYQISQIVDRSALNENFDANVYGFDLEAKINLTDRLNIISNLGFLKIKISSDTQSIDVMNRTQGNDDWILIKPWLQMASNCIAPRRFVEIVANSNRTTVSSLPDLMAAFCPGRIFFDYLPGSTAAGRYGFTYDPATDAPNFGRGFAAPVKGNELPNSPNWTFNISGNYRIPIGQWNILLSADHYIQDKSWSRVYNTEIDRLKSWSNTNVSISLANESDSFQMQLYVKNLFDKSPITDMHLNSDDSGLTSNVFTLDPRIIGLNVISKF